MLGEPKPTLKTVSTSSSGGGRKRPRWGLPRVTKSVGKIFGGVAGVAFPRPLLKKRKNRRLPPPRPARLVWWDLWPGKASRGEGPPQDGMLREGWRRGDGSMLEIKPFKRQTLRKKPVRVLSQGGGRGQSSSDGVRRRAVVHPAPWPAGPSFWRGSSAGSKGTLKPGWRGRFSLPCQVKGAPFWLGNSGKSHLWEDK